MIKPALEGILAGESVHHVEFRFVHRNGAVRWISETCNAQWHEGQQCWVVTTVAVDISDYKTAEVALRQSEARLQVITDSIPGCISYVDAEQRYRFVNRTYEEWFNCQKADLLGRTVEEVVGPTAYRQAQRPISKRCFQGRQPPLFLDSQIFKTPLTGMETAAYHQGF